MSVHVQSKSVSLPCGSAYTFLRSWWLERAWLRMPGRGRPCCWSCSWGPYYGYRSSESAVPLSKRELGVTYGHLTGHSPDTACSFQKTAAYTHTGSSLPVLRTRTPTQPLHVSSTDVTYAPNPQYTSKDHASHFVHSAHKSSQPGPYVLGTFSESSRARSVPWFAHAVCFSPGPRPAS
jgi:hypothetical protein